MLPRAALVAVLVVVLLLATWALSAVIRRCGGRARFLPGGPYNLGLYNVPYYYPVYEGRAVLDWDPDRRCTAYCSQSPCVTWCR